MYLGFVKGVGGRYSSDDESSEDSSFYPGDCCIVLL